MLYPRNGYSKPPVIRRIQSQRCSAETEWMQPYESSGTPRFKMPWNQKRLPRVRCAEMWSGRADLNLSRFAGVRRAATAAAGEILSAAKDLSEHVAGTGRFELEPSCGP